MKFEDENSAQFTHFNILTKLESYYKVNLGVHIQVFRVKENKSKNPPKDTWIGVLIRDLPLNITK